MKRLIPILLLLVSGVAYAGIGDKYLCEVLTYTEANHQFHFDARARTFVLERDYEDGLYYYFFLDWTSEKTAQLSRIKIYRGVPEVRSKWEISIIGSFPTEESKEGFSGRHMNVFETLQMTFNEISGYLLLHLTEGKGLDLGVPVYYEIRSMKCVKTPAQSLEHALLTLKAKKWPKQKNTEENLICNLKALSRVGIYVAGGDSKSSYVFRLGAANDEIYEYLTGSLDAYERMLVDDLKRQLPMLKIYSRDDTNDVNQEGEIEGNFSCGIWTVGNSTNTIGLNVSCNLLVNYSNWHTRESYESYESYEVDFPIVERMGLVSREKLGDTVAAFIKAATTESVLEFYKKREDKCKDS